MSTKFFTQNDNKWGWGRGDNPGYYGDHWSSWSNWQTTSCFKGIDFRVSRTKKKDRDGDYKWRVDVRNRYNEGINYDLNLSTVRPYSIDCERPDCRSLGRDDVDANQTDGGTWNAYFKEGNSIYVTIYRVEFDSEYEYYECDY